MQKSEIIAGILTSGITLLSNLQLTTDLSTSPLPEHVIPLL